MLGYVAICVGTALLFLDVYLVYISLGFRKNNCNKCKGYLASTSQYRNHYVEGKLEDSISIIWNMYMYIA